MVIFDVRRGCQALGTRVSNLLRAAEETSAYLEHIRSLVAKRLRVGVGKLSGPLNLEVSGNILRRRVTRPYLHAMLICTGTQDGAISLHFLPSFEDIGEDH